MSRAPGHRFWVCLAVLALGLVPALASAPERSPRPMARAQAQAVQPRAVRVPVYYRSQRRPVARPVDAGAAGARIFLVPVHFRADLRPVARPDRAPRQPASGAAQDRAVAQITPAADGKARKLCGSRDIRGQTLAPIRGTQPGCGVKDPVQVSQIGGVALRPAAIVDCRTAKAMERWVEDGVTPTIGRLGGGVAQLQVAASYACRTRNNRPGAKISEHGKGRAVDISAVTLKNGVVLSVERDWRDPVKGKLLRRLHQAGCGPFATVLGPDADRYHQDHFHFDAAQRSSGRYCR